MLRRELLRLEFSRSRRSVILRVLEQSSETAASGCTIACEVLGYRYDNGEWEVPVGCSTAKRWVRDIHALALDPGLGELTYLDDTHYKLTWVVEGKTQVLQWGTVVPRAWDDLLPILAYLVEEAGPRADRHVDIFDLLNEDYRPLRP